MGETRADPNFLPSSASLQCKLQKFPRGAKIFLFGTKRKNFRQDERDLQDRKQSPKVAGAPSGAKRSCHPVKILFSLSEPLRIALELPRWLRLRRAKPLR